MSIHPNEAIPIGLKLAIKIMPPTMAGNIHAIFVLLHCEHSSSLDAIEPTVALDLTSHCEL